MFILQWLLHDCAWCNNYNQLERAAIATAVATAASRSVVAPREKKQQQQVECRTLEGQRSLSEVHGRAGQQEQLHSHDCH